MYTYWKEHEILEKHSENTVCVCMCVCMFWHMPGVTLVKETSCRSHVERFERLLSVRSCQDSGAVRMQHRSRYDEDAVWRHGRLQSHGVHSFWDAVAAVKLPRCKARTIPLDEKINF